MTVHLRIPSSIKNRTMDKLVHHLVEQVIVLVSLWHRSFLKGIFGQTLVSLLLPHYYLDFIADLALVFGVMICQVVFVTTFAYNFGIFV